MKHLAVLEKVFTCDRLMKLTLDIFLGIRGEIKADIEEILLIAESISNEEANQGLSCILKNIEKIFIPKLDEVIDSIYDDYEMFNFDISVFSNMVEYIEKDIKNIDPVNTLTARVDFLMLILKDILEPALDNEVLKALISPFLIYEEVLKHLSEFLKSFEKTYMT